MIARTLAQYKSGLSLPAETCSLAFTVIDKGFRRCIATPVRSMLSGGQSAESNMCIGYGSKNSNIWPSSAIGRTGFSGGVVMWGGPFQIAGRLGSAPLARRKNSSSLKVFSEPLVSSSMLFCVAAELTNHPTRIISHSFRRPPHFCPDLETRPYGSPWAVDLLSFPYIRKNMRVSPHFDEALKFYFQCRRADIFDYFFMPGVHSQEWLCHGKRKAAGRAGNARPALQGSGKKAA